MAQAKTLTEFLALYNPNDEHDVTTIEAAPPTIERQSPFIIVNHGLYTALICPMALADHLCVDVHSFVDGQAATGGVFGMTNGRRMQFPDTGNTSHGWPSSGLVAVLVGEQSGEIL